MRSCSKEALLERTHEFNCMFDQLFQSYRTDLIVCANEVVKDTLVAEDIVTDAFIRFWENPKKYESLSKAKGFLYISTMNACRNFLNQRRYYKKQLKHFRSAQPTHSNLMNDLIRKEVFEEVCDLLQQMPAKSRQTAVMYFMRRTSCRKLSKKLNKAPSTVKNNLQYAIRFLQKRFRFEEAA